MASKVTPYFILTSEGVAIPDVGSNSDVTQHDTDTEKTTSSKDGLQLTRSLTTMTRHQLTRKRMDLIRQKLEESRARHAEKQKNSPTLTFTKPVPRIGDAFMPYGPHTYISPDVPQKPPKDTKRNLEMVPLSTRQPGANGDLPYVYFVVSVDRLPKSRLTSQSLDESSASTYNSMPVKKKNKNLTRTQKKYRVDKSDSPAMVSKSDGNLNGNSRQIPQKNMVFPFQHPNDPVNPPATPATITTFVYDKSDDDFLNENKISMEDLAAFHAGRSYNQGKTSARLIELPYISADQQRKNLGSSNSSMEGKAMEVYRKTVSQDSSNRKVHFAESFDLPSITGSSLSFPRGLLTHRFGPRPTTMPAIMSCREEEEEHRQRYEHRDLPKRAFGTPRGKKNVQPLNLPKIDIVSGVYDELIVKAIESYIQEFRPGSKQFSVARQLLKQLQERSLTVNDLAQMERKTRTTGKVTIKELDPEPMRSNDTSPSGKTSRGGPRRPVKPKQDKEFSTLAPTCFQMIPPGSQSARNEITITSLK